MNTTTIFAPRCAGCAAHFESIPADGAYRCSYCGLNQQIQRPALQQRPQKHTGTGRGKQHGAVLSRILGGTDRTASELAIVRLQDEIAQLRSSLPYVDVGFVVRMTCVLLVFVALGSWISYKVGAALAIVTAWLIWARIRDVERAQLEHKAISAQILAKSTELEAHREVVSQPFGQQ